MHSPQEVARNYVSIGTGKAKLPISKMIALGILAGLFIAFAGVGAATVQISISAPSVARLAGACVFPAGLSMVLLAGSELFTGNSLLIIPVLEKEIKLIEMLKNWLFVYIGNFIGSIIVSLLFIYSHLPSSFGDALGGAVINTAAAKVSMSFADALLRGIMCNFLVCISVWISFAAKSVGGKVAGLFFPIMLFVLSGFEHSVANMYYISAGIFAKSNPAYLAAATADVSSLNWGTMFTKNLIPVTLGNIIGGMVLVGMGYWFIYLRDKNTTANK